MFGYPEVRLERPESDVDPFSGYVWPDRHGKRLDYRRVRTADPKWAWERNRCQELPLLVACWLLADDERYGRAAAARMLAWIDAHPPGRGIAWSNGFEAGMRVCSLAVAFDALRGAGFLGRAETSTVLRAIWQPGRWIECDPSLGSSANNHRLGELVGLVAVGALAPELRDSSRRLDDALTELEREEAKQIQPDGTTAEQAFAYHVFVVDLLLLASALLESRAAWCHAGSSTRSPFRRRPLGAARRP